jgi:hypothetical protein
VGERKERRQQVKEKREKEGRVEKRWRERGKEHPFGIVSEVHIHACIRGVCVSL